MEDELNEWLDQQTDSFIDMLDIGFPEEDEDIDDILAELDLDE